MWEKDINLFFDNCLGYFYFCDTTHPLVNKSGKIYFHRHVASLKVGRWLTTDEHVHHIDEDKTNNAPENLEILSAAEHYKRHLINNGFCILSEYICKCCGDIFYAWNNAQKCCSRHCNSFLNRKVERPSKKELEKLIWELPTTKLAKNFGVSDKAIEKWCKNYSIQKPPRGYWSKVCKN